MQNAFETFVRDFFFVLLGEKCYKSGGRKASERLTWEKALERCRNYGGDLVSIQSQEEQGNNLHLAIDCFCRYYWCIT